METKFKTVLGNLAYCIHSDSKIVVVVHSQGNPTDEEWYENFIPSTLKLAEMGLASRVIIYSDGGAPNSDQRKALNQFYDTVDRSGQVLKIALVSQAPSAIRIAVMVLNVFFAKNRLRMFDSLDAATGWLGLPTDQNASLSALVESLRQAIPPEAARESASAH
jgi:hypothetical protein